MSSIMYVSDVSSSTPMNSMTKASLSSSLNSTGWSVIRNLHDSETIASLQELCFAELSELQVTDRSLNKGQPRFINSSDDSVSQAATLQRVRKSELLRKLCEPAGFVEELASFYDAEVFIHPNQWVRAMPPDTEEWAVAPSVHADCFELQGSLRQITVWSPIFPVSSKSGSLPIYNTKNGNGIPSGLELSNDNQSGWTLNEDYLGPKTIPELSAGDALVFLATTPHGGSQNLSKGWRISVETRYQPMTDPIDRNALNPYDGSTWEEFQKTWNDKGRPWENLHPKPTGFDPVWEDWRAVEALKVGSLGDSIAVQALTNALLHSNPGIRAEAQNLLDRYGWV